MPLSFVRWIYIIVNSDSLVFLCKYIMLNNDKLGVPYAEMNGKIPTLSCTVQSIVGKFNIFYRTLPWYDGENDTFIRS